MEDNSLQNTTNASGTNQDTFSRFTRFCLYYTISAVVIVIAQYITDDYNFWHSFVWFFALHIMKSMTDKAVTFLPFKLKDSK